MTGTGAAGAPGATGMPERDYAALPAIVPVAEPRLYLAIQRLARQRRTTMANIVLTACERFARDPERGTAPLYHREERG